jgi:hypothetical protein
MFIKERTIKDWCKELHISNYVIEDGLVNVSASVELYCRKLGKIPIQFGKIAGDFYCHDNKLVSLEGSPKEVLGGFYCRYNKLISLKGGPIKVGVDFICESNKLTSLKGGPKKVNLFNCENNPVYTEYGKFNNPATYHRYYMENLNQDVVPEKTIEDWCKKLGVKYYTIVDGFVNVDSSVNLSCKNLTEFPIKFGVVTGGFNCNDNELTSLEGSPREIGKGFNCKGNKLTSLKGGPINVKGGYYCQYNNLTSLEGGPIKLSGGLDCGYNPIHEEYSKFKNYNQYMESLKQDVEMKDFKHGEEITYIFGPARHKYKGTYMCFVAESKSHLVKLGKNVRNIEYLTVSDCEIVKREPEAPIPFQSRFIPALGEEYFFISNDLKNVKRVNDDSDIDKNNIIMANCFKTWENLLVAINKEQTLVKMLDYMDELNGTDWHTIWNSAWNTEGFVYLVQNINDYKFLGFNPIIYRPTYIPKFIFKNRELYDKFVDRFEKTFVDMKWSV